MKNLFKYGIDLGTTNSCIAKYEDNEVKFYLNNDQMHITPSAVYINRTGRKIVGRKALNAMITDLENVTIEFKRLMGEDIKYTFKAAGLSLSSEELSAEILKSLRNDVQRLENEEMRTAVITVPAAFSSRQCAATDKAANLAGLQEILMLQEPIAASLAYGVRPGSKDQKWLVFDLGGGTLDIAVVTTQDDRLKILNHEGDNFLGGKDIDRMILEKYLLPIIEENFKLPETPDNKSLLFRRLQIKAEDAKISLSSNSETIVDLFDLGEDANGKRIEGECLLKQTDLEKILEPVVKKCLYKTSVVIGNAGLSNDDFDRILLVGGSTQIPLFRTLLQEETGIEVDYSLNPITVVASGAAIYASLCETETVKQIISLAMVKDTVSLELSYDHVSSALSETVIGVFKNRGEHDISEVQVQEQSGFWESGWITLSEDLSFEMDVFLREDKENYFICHARNKGGEQIAIIPDHFTISHKKEHLKVSQPPLPHTISVEVIMVDAKTKLVPIITKNTPLPAEGTQTFKVAKTLFLGSDDSSLPIKLWEGEIFDNPKLNSFVGSIPIDANEIEKAIREDTEIEVIVKIDKSRRINVTADIKEHDRVFKGYFLVMETESIDKKIEDTFNILDDCYKFLMTLKSKSTGDHLATIKSMIQDVEDLDASLSKEKRESTHGMKNEELINGLNSQAKECFNRIIQLKDEIEGLEKDNRVINVRHIEQQIDEKKNTVGKYVEKYGGKEDKDEFKQISTTIEKISKVEDDRDKKRSYDSNLKNLEELSTRVLFSNFEFLQEWYRLLEKKKFINEEEANKWLVIGRKAKAQKSREKLEKSVRELLKLLPQNVVKKIQEEGLLPGLKE